jgi:transcriptional regulator with XRE-family HTH domain
VTYETLRMAREKKGWTLEELSRRAGVRPKAIEQIERGEFAELPGGLYGRSAIRNYAAAVGLDPQQILDEVRTLLPAGEDPLDGLARRYGHTRRAEKRAEESAASIAASRPAAEVAMRGIAPDASDGLPLSRLRFDAVRGWGRPLTASVIDGLLLAVLGGVLVWLTAIACGTTIPVALRSGAPGIALVFAIIVALYFVLFGGVGNATPGLALMHLQERTSGRTVLNARDVFGRACRSILRDSSVLAE